MFKNQLFKDSKNIFWYDDGERIFRGRTFISSSDWQWVRYGGSTANGLRRKLVRLVIANQCHLATQLEYLLTTGQVFDPPNSQTKGFVPIETK